MGCAAGGNIGDTPEIEDEAGEAGLFGLPGSTVEKGSVDGRPRLVVTVLVGKTKDCHEVCG